MKCEKCQVELTNTNAMGSEKILYDIDICRTCFGYPAFSEQGIKCEGPRFKWDGALAVKQEMEKKAALSAALRPKGDGQPGVQVDQGQGKVG